MTSISNGIVKTFDSSIETKNNQPNMAFISNVIGQSFHIGSRVGGGEMIFVQ